MESDPTDRQVNGSTPLEALPYDDFLSTAVQQHFEEDDVEAARTIARACSIYVKLHTTFAVETMQEATARLDHLDASQKAAEEAVIQLCPEMLEGLQATVDKWQREHPTL